MHTRKGQRFEAVEARPSVDPVLERRGDGPLAKRQKLDDGMPENERLNDRVTPLWRDTYELQLIKKKRTMVSQEQKVVVGFARGERLGKSGSGKYKLLKSWPV